MAAMAAAMLSCDCKPGGTPGNPGGGMPKGGGPSPRGGGGTDEGGILGAAWNRESVKQISIYTNATYEEVMVTLWKMMMG